MGTRLDPLARLAALAALLQPDVNYTTAWAGGNNPEASPYHFALNGVNQTLNLAFKSALWMTLGALCFAILIFRSFEGSWAQLRLISSMGRPASEQTYWKVSQPSWMPTFKRSIWYSPLGTKRHNREMKLGSAHMGCVPSRLHSIIIFVYALFNIIYCFALDWTNPDKYSMFAELRGRAGTLAVVNMVPLVLLAGRNNPLISILHISFDTYNLVHRWLGRLAVAEAVLHASAWFYVTLSDGGMSEVKYYVTTHIFHACGLIAVSCMIVLFVMALSPIRHAFYETFLNLHILLAFVIFVCVYVHCLTPEVPDGLPQTSWMYAIALFWFGDRCRRMSRLAYVNWSMRGTTQATLEPMPSDATRVTFHLPRHVDVRPGTHCYVRILSVNGWECHPFSVAWVRHVPMNLEALPMTEKPSAAMASGRVVDRSNTTTDVSFIIGAQKGWTRKLFNKASEGTVQNPLRVAGAIEGPYSGHHSLDSYGHAVLFAGATGITHQVSYLTHLIRGYNSGMIATRRVVLVWIIRDFDMLEWVRPWMDEILAMPNRKQILRIQIYVTRPKKSQDLTSPSDTVQMLAGRPNPALILRREVMEQIGSMCVTICGPGALADDIRDAVRHVQTGETVVDFVEESFTW